MSYDKLFAIVAIGCMLLLVTRGLSGRGVARQKMLAMIALWIGIFAVVFAVIWIVQNGPQR